MVSIEKEVINYYIFIVYCILCRDYFMHLLLKGQTDALDPYEMAMFKELKQSKHSSQR